MTWLLILGFTISSSLDNLGVGICYGIRNIRINILSNLIIAVMCFLLSYCGILFGHWISTVLPGSLPTLLGVFILLVIGLRIILLAAPRNADTLENSKPVEATDVNDKKASGLAAVLKNPECVDFDNSKDIGILEAVILGFALAANAVTNGLTAGLLGLSPLLISVLAAIGSFVTIQLGVTLGCKVAHVRIGSFSLGQFGTLTSGIILILIAVGNLF